MKATKEAVHGIQLITQTIHVMHPSDFSQYHISGGKYVLINRKSGPSTELILLQSEFNPLFKKFAYRTDHVGENAMLILELSLLSDGPSEDLKDKFEYVYLSDFNANFYNPLQDKGHFPVKTCSADFRGFGDTWTSRFTGALDRKNAVLLEKIVMFADNAPVFRVMPKEFVYHS